MASIHLCNIPGLVPVLYDVLKHCKGASILNIASSDMNLYMTLLCICFRYYLCSIVFLSSPKMMIIMYFSHYFPLTSHMRGHLLSTQMALLHLSAENSLCWYTKGHLRIEICQNTIDGHEMRCIYPSTSLPFYFSKYGLAYTTISIETHIHT